jgi:hypothetical protein
MVHPQEFRTMTALDTLALSLSLAGIIAIAGWLGKRLPAPDEWPEAQDDPRQSAVLHTRGE